MSETSIKGFIIEKNGEKIIQHTTKRKIIESSFVMLFLAVGIIAIVFGAIFTDQSLFFRISLIVIGCIISSIYLENFISIMTNKIIISTEGVKFRNYFRWTNIFWIELDSIEAERKGTRRNKEGEDTRYTTIQINTTDDKRILFPIFRFKPQEADTIVEVIKETYKQTQNKDLIEKVVKPETEIKPITDIEIEKQIPPKVKDEELHNE